MKINWNKVFGMFSWSVKALVNSKSIGESIVVGAFSLWIIILNLIFLLPLILVYMEYKE